VSGGGGEVAMSAAEQHRAEAIEKLALALGILPGFGEARAEQRVAEIADSLIAAAVETFRDLRAAEDKLEREAEADSLRLG
jgi:hypothetical protein